MSTESKEPVIEEPFKETKLQKLANGLGVVAIFVVPTATVIAGTIYSSKITKMALETAKMNLEAAKLNAGQ